MDLKIEGSPLWIPCSEDPGSYHLRLSFCMGGHLNRGYYLIDLTKKTLTANFTYNSQIPSPPLPANFLTPAFGQNLREN